MKTVSFNSLQRHPLGENVELLQFVYIRFRGPEVIGQLAARLFLGQMCLLHHYFMQNRPKMPKNGQDQ